MLVSSTVHPFPAQLVGEQLDGPRTDAMSLVGCGDQEPDEVWRSSEPRARR
jgi:hypothetical protein